MSVPPPPLAFPHPGPPPERPELPAGVTPPADAPEQLPNWPAWTAPVALVAGFTAAILGIIVISAVAAAGGVSISDPPPGIVVGGTVFQDLSLICSALVFARMRGPWRPRQFGLCPTRTGALRAVGWMALGYVIFILFTALWAQLVGSTSDEGLPKDLGVDNSTVNLVAAAVLVTVVAPIAEEFFFRGYFFTAVRTWKGPWVSAVLTGLVFGAIHLGSAKAVFLVPLAFLGFVLCLLRWRTGSLYPCMALHAANNAIAFGVSEHWGWQIPLVFAGALALISALVLPFGERPRVRASASGRAPA